MQHREHMARQPTAVIYVRVSTKGQAERDTIEAQVTWAKEAIERDGVKLPGRRMGHARTGAASRTSGAHGSGVVRSDASSGGWRACP
jgi:hypothetical protein